MDRLTAAPEHCFWGFLDPALEPVITVDDGTELTIEAVTHHAGDAPDLLMDDGIRAIWAAIAEADPGSRRAHHDRADRGPGASRATRWSCAILDMTPRLPYGSNCAANWGLLYDTFGKERITIYGLDVDGREFPATATPEFAFDFTARPLYDLPGVISRARPVCARAVRPAGAGAGAAALRRDGSRAGEPGRLSSIPPGVFGGNVDNWRLGPGATMCYPVFAEGAELYVGDPHFAQGDGEICGTAIEASLDATIQVLVGRQGVGNTSPLLGDRDPLVHARLRRRPRRGDADGRRADAVADRRPLGLSRRRRLLAGLGRHRLGVTQVVDGTLGCHAGIAKTIFS